MMYSLARMERARIVQVIFLSPCETKALPSRQNKFLHSCPWFHLLSAEDFGSLPILTVPASWMTLPGLFSPHWLASLLSFDVTIAPILCSSSLKVSFICLACLISYSECLTLKRRTGMPYLSTTPSESISQ